MNRITIKMIFLARVAMTLFFAVTTTVTAVAKEYITDVMLIGGTKNEVNALKDSYGKQGWIVIDKDLNAGAGGDYIYLLYKTENNTDGYNYGYITGFYLQNKSSSKTTATLTSEGHLYKIVPYDGGDHFKGQKGDLNSNTGASTDPIHLYYTTDIFTDNRAVTDISFNSNKSGAVGKEGGSEAYDLNAGAGGDYIYLHYSTGTVTPRFSGKGTTASPFLISSTDEWNILADCVNRGLNADKCYKLADNIDVSTMVGTSDHPFCGTFDGDGKTLQVNISESGNAALFKKVNGATIKNITVMGSVTGGGNHTAGLVSECEGNITIKGCTVAADVDCDSYAGGIVGHGGTNSTLQMENNVYSGTISGFKHFAGGLLGWCNEITLNMTNCLFKGKFSSGSDGKYHPIACRHHTRTVVATVTSTYYLNTAAPSEELGENVITGAEGTEVSKEFVSGSYEREVKAADGQTYYVTVRTGMALPYSYGFENGMGGWTLVNGVNGSKILSTFSFEGEKIFKFESCNQDQILISPEFYSTSKVMMEVSYCGDENKNVKFKLGHSKTTSDLNAFEWSEETIDMIIDKGERSTIFFPRGTKYVAIKSLAGGGPLYVDDIVLSEPYPYPADLTPTELTDKSVTLSWKAPESNYTIKYYKYTFKRESEQIYNIATTTNTSITFSDLRPDSKYEFSVYAHYEGTDGGFKYNANSESVTCSFTTKPTSLPYTENFEGDMYGWNRENCDANSGIYNTVGREGSKAFLFNTADKAQYIISPQFDSSSPVKVSFYYKKANGSAAFSVAPISVTGEMTFGSPEVTVTSDEWGKYVMYYPKGTKYILVLCHKADGLLLIDDFIVEATTISIPWTGKGSEAEPYLISSTTDLDQLAAIVNTGEGFSGKNFKLGNDIAYSPKTDWNDAASTENNYTAIGDESNPFRGHFDGAGKVISGIRINSTGSYQGLFGCIDGATISNVTISDARITGASFCGTIVGNNGGALSHNYYLNCSVGSAGNGINVGTGSGDVTENNGAVSVHQLTLADGISATPVAIIYGSVNYYAQGSTITLAYTGGESGGNEEITYSVNSTSIEGNTFTMPAADASVSVTLVPESKGDANGDKVVDTSDIPAIVNAMTGHPTDNFSLENVDFDGDGVITIADIIRFVNDYLGK